MFGDAPLIDHKQTPAETFPARLAHFSAEHKTEHVPKLSAAVTTIDNTFRAASVGTKERTTLQQ